MDIYEVDECHLHVNTHNHGKILEAQKYWVVRIFYRENKQISLRVSRVRNSLFLNQFVSDFVPIGSIIISEMWRGYNGLNYLGFVHKRVKHKEYFVDPDDSEIHTNNIERTWRSVREWLPLNLSEEYVSLRLKNFEVEFNLRIVTVEERFNFVLSASKIS